MGSEKNIIIIDSNSLIHRAFHALPPLTHKGQPTGAVYGFLLTLFKAIKDIKATHIIACFDTPAITFRDDIFKEYKSQRPATHKDIVSQIHVVKEVLKAFSVPVFEKDGFEADDLIATLATKAKGEAKVFIVSGDLDNLQLVDQIVKVYTLGKGVKDSIIYDEARVQERFGVSPRQMNDFKALTGDVSDNIPGVPGIGKTTAASLIQQFGSIQNLYEELATDTAVLKPKVKEALKQNKESALLSLELVKTKKDVDISFNLEEALFGRFDQEKVKQKFNELGFFSLSNKLGELGA